jgi:hypothetical protein
METKTKVIIGVSTAVVIIAVGAVVYFKVLKPKAMMVKAQEDAENEKKKQLSSGADELQSEIAATGTAASSASGNESVKSEAKKSAEKIAAAAKAAAINAGKSIEQAKQEAVKAVKEFRNDVVKGGGLVSFTETKASNAAKEIEGGLKTVKDFIFGKTGKGYALYPNVKVYNSAWKHVGTAPLKGSMIGSDMKLHSDKSWVVGKNSAGGTIYAPAYAVGIKY